ncbi:uncharacterized protein LOC131015448 [Salvia miltiorrhiza]|uniref:uncharacterized protein LOC131015448 n=1 Tax=Salvia miltiorrhiza TaxID=226208 RepID=UPI0025AB9446|nr:uncharacterized protein LOC131015448 [Salvia miltiorrhiza]XP_057799843.1 uncharacterized protein LOC131015448 [Salvia miltiorrhiza]XP_057799844.1 uncharacterized protein LOC131015448 [Salvia miltiorrhiza]
MATNAKSSNFAKLKPAVGDGPSSSKPRFDPSASKKKFIVGSIRNSAADSKNRSIFSGSSKMTKKTFTQTKDDKKTVTRTREKKVYSLPGQKFDVPEEREPLRIFYESLSKQIPSSEMAEFWLMEHGMLSPERARRAYEKKQRKQKQLRSGAPIKSPPPSTSSRPESSKKPQPVPKNGEVKAKKRIMEDSEDDDDFVLSHKRRRA